MCLKKYDLREELVSDEIVKEIVNMASGNSKCKCLGIFRYEEKIRVVTKSFILDINSDRLIKLHDTHCSANSRVIENENINNMLSESQGVKQ